MEASPPIPHAAIVRLIGPQAKRADGRKAPLAAAPAGFFLKTVKLGYHRGASWIKSVSLVWGLRPHHGHGLKTYHEF